MVKNKEELNCFALLINDWNSFYSFGVNSGNPKLKADTDYKNYDRTISLELICATYQDERSLKLLNDDKVVVHFVPKPEDHISPLQSTLNIQDVKNTQNTFKFA